MSLGPAVSTNIGTMSWWTVLVRLSVIVSLLFPQVCLSAVSIESCQLGTYSTDADQSGDCSGFRLCEPGYYCTEDYEKVLCPPGTYGSDEGLYSDDCSGLCAAGFYCPEGSTSNTQFPCGNDSVYCPEGSASPTAVDTGYYSVDGSYHADGWDNRTRTSQLLCPQGHFCVDGVRRGCPPGTYSAEFGATSCDQVCPAGFHCPLGSIEPVPCEGSKVYCPEGSSRPLVVQPRHYAVSDTAANVRGANRSSAQVFCPPGSFCIDGIKYECPAGRYGSSQGEIDPLCSGECEEGHYCPKASTSPRQVVCGGADVYCPPASIEPTPVTPGFYTVGGESAVTQNDQVQCEEGYWCENGVRFECFEGHYGAEKGLVSGTCSGQCYAGFYCEKQSTSPMQYVCGDETFFCPIGSSAPTPVSDGHYTIDPAENGGMTAERLCGIGHYCTAGEQHECWPGHFGSSYGNTAPTCDGECYEGYYCTSGSTLPTQHVCGGFDVYCTPGSNRTTAVSEGYYTINNNSIAGESGTYGTDGLTQSGQRICEPGHFCKNGVKRQCPAAKYGEIEGLSSFACTGVCEAGYYCPPGSVSAREHQCGAADVWCPEGSALPTPVSVGYYTLPEPSVSVVYRSSAETCFTDAVWSQVRSCIH